MDQCLAEPAVDKRLSNRHKNCQHGNQTKLLGQKQTGQNNGDDKLNPLLAEAFKKAPEEGTQCPAF